MIYFYIFLVAIATLPAVIVILRIKRARMVKRNGVYTNAVIRNITTQQFGRGSRLDRVIFEYRDRNTGSAYSGQAMTVPYKYKVGDPLQVIYLPGNPSKYAMDGGKTYWPLLIFCILLFAFVIFAIYKLDGMTANTNYKFRGTIENVDPYRPID